MEEITSLIITKKAASYWVYQVNGETQTRDANAYTGTREGDYFTMGTRTGAPQLVNVYYAVISYVDELDSGNNVNAPASSPEALQAHLIAQGFYEAGSTGGGGTGAEYFTDLGDTFASYIGREGHNITVNASGTGLTSAQNSIPTLQQLANYLGGSTIPKNHAVITSSVDNGSGSAIGFTTAPLYNLINRPAGFFEFAIIRKGWTWVDGILNVNQEEYAMEVGDICSFIYNDDANQQLWYYPYARYKGGEDLGELTNWEAPYRLRLAYEGEPDYMP